MKKDDRLYAFIVAHTSRPRSRIRRISIHKRWLKVASVLAALTVCAAAYGLVGMYREAAHLRVERENERLRVENERQKQKLEQLKDRVDAIEDASRRLAESAGVSEENASARRGSGGPLVKMGEAEIAAVEARASRLEERLKSYEAAIKVRSRIPSIWPVDGETTDGFGGRRNPFGGYSTEFHPGQDIRAERGTPVVVAADGAVTFAGWKSGYGQMIEVDHGGGLATRYAHLSKIGVAVGDRLSRGQLIGQVGSTGRSTGPHLHYEVRIDGESVNPLSYLPARGEATNAGDAAKPQN